MDWDKLRVFHAVAEAGSVTHAGETLHLSQSAVSRQISALERAVGAPLFHRHPRGLILTSEGEILHEATQDMVMQLASATGRIRGVREGVYGALRVTTPLDFGTFWLIPRLPKLLAAHPGLTIDLCMTEMVLDLPMREADAAIRMRAPKQADVIARQLWSSPFGLFATQDYLDAAGTPEKLEDLRNHALVIYSPKSPQPAEEMDRAFRALGDGPALRPRLIVNSQFGVLEAVRSGVGIAMLPEHRAREFGLVRVIQGFAGPELGVYFVYAKEMRRSKRIMVLRNFIEDELGIDEKRTAISR